MVEEYKNFQRGDAELNSLDKPNEEIKETYTSQALVLQKFLNVLEIGQVDHGCKTSKNDVNQRFKSSKDITASIGKESLSVFKDKYR